VTAPAPRYPGIDVLRGVSVLLVLLHHIHLRFVLGHYPVAELLPKPVGRVLFWSGYYAVLMFFVISGFVITNVSLRRWTTLTRIEVLPFYRLRIARIAPCLVLLLALLSVLHLAGVYDYVIDPKRSSLTRALVAATTFHLNWLEGTRGYLPGSWDVLWSLSIEEAFYIFFPLVCAAARREYLLAIPALVLIAAGPVSRVYDAGPEPWDEYAYLSCTDGLAFGCVAAWLHARIAPSRGWRIAALSGGSLLMLFVLICRGSVQRFGLITSGTQVTLLELGTAAVLVAFAGGSAERAMSRGTGWLRQIGSMSYEIYLTHMFVLVGAMHIFRATGAGISLIWAWYIGMLVTSVLLGYVVSTYYSTPANQALRGVALTPGRQPAVGAEH
jgi:peptidoglycan/LPS O-acetylase OafA/YrhL